MQGFDIYASPYTASSVSLGHDTLANDGSVDFTGLLPGSYVIKETTTPAGYGTMSDINITIAANWAMLKGLSYSTCRDTFKVSCLL